MKLFAYERLSSLVEQMLVIVAKKRHDKQVREMFHPGIYRILAVPDNPAKFCQIWQFPESGIRQ